MSPDDDTDDGATSRNIEVLASARELAQIQKRYPRSTTNQLAAREGMEGRDVRRKLALMTLPAEVLGMVEDCTLPLVTADALTRPSLLPHEQIGLARKVAEGVCSFKRRHVREMVTSYLKWSAAARTAFLTDPAMTFEEARERWKTEVAEAEDREARAREVRERGARLRKQVGGKVVTADEIIRDFNTVMRSIQDDPMNPRRIDPMGRKHTVSEMLEAIDNATMALVALGEGNRAKSALEMLVLTAFEEPKGALPDPRVIVVASATFDTPGDTPDDS